MLPIHLQILLIYIIYNILTRAMTVIVVVIHMTILADARRNVDDPHSKNDESSHSHI